MSQHTPGPWKIEGDEIYGPNGQRIADVWSGYEDEIHADARLIAAAPDLLEFAEEVRRTGDTRLASMAIAVIAKAIGEAK